MSYIEGIGDELLLIFLLLTVVAILSLIWVSTSVVPPPRGHVIIVDGRRFQDTVNRIRQAGIRIVTLNRVLGNNTQDPPVASSDTNSSNREDDALPPGSSPPGSSAEKAETTTAKVKNDVSSSENSTKFQVSNDQPSTSSSLFGGEELLVDECIVSASSEREHVVTDAVNSGQGNSADGKDKVETLGSFSDIEINIETSVNSSNNSLRSRNSEEKDGDKIPGNVCDKSCDEVIKDSNGSVETSHKKGKDSTVAGQQPGSLFTPIYHAEEPQTTSTSSEPPESSDQVRIKLKYLDDRQKTVLAKLQQTIGEFKRNHFATELAENLMVRLIHNGQELRPDNKSLQAYNIRDSSVIHCLMSQNSVQNSTNVNQAHQEDDDLNIGAYIFPLFGVILGLIWYSRIAYGRYFNAMSTLSLVFITFMYLIVLLATLRTREGNNHPQLIAQNRPHQD